MYLFDLGREKKKGNMEALQCFPEVYLNKEGIPEGTNEL